MLEWSDRDGHPPLAPPQDRPRKAHRMATRTRRDIHADITNQIADALDRNLIPWRKDWTNPGASLTLPNNPYSHTTYRGINVPVLWAAQIRDGYTTPQWATYRQIAEHDGQVRKGEKATTIVFWRFVDREDPTTGDTHRVPFARGYAVFNLDQADGIEPAAPALPDSTWERTQNLHGWLERIPADVRHHASDSAYYLTGLDHIVLPLPEQFRSEAGYLATRTHETGHWTGHDTRLNRDLTGRFGTNSYAAEELVAELTAAFVCGEFGVDYDLEKHASYVQNWAQVLRADKTAIFTAASAAQKAVDYLHGLAGTAAGGADDLEPADSETTAA